MAELPGWDRDRLAIAEPADVAAARLVVFARRAKPILVEDYDLRLRELALTDMTGSRRERAERSLRAEARQRLEQARTLQADLRRRLELDAPDEEPTDG